MMEEGSAAEATVRGLLRRLRQHAPEARGVFWQGEERETFLRVAGAEGFHEEKGERAEVSVAYYPHGAFDGTIHGRTLLVVATDAVVEGDPAILSERDAVRSLPLREWVAGWQGGASPLARILRGLLVSPAVAERLWETKLPGNREWIFGLRSEGRRAGPGVGETAKFLLVTFFGTGLSPVMPATVASACFVPLGLGVLWLGGEQAFWLAAVALAVLSSIGSVWLERWAERRFLAEDPRQFVLDEVAGLTLTWALLPGPVSWWGVVLGFVAFRVFDIFKWGITWVERLPIRGKVLWDDLLAGLYAAAICWAILRGAAWLHGA